MQYHSPNRNTRLAEPIYSIGSFLDLIHKRTTLERFGKIISFSRAQQIYKILIDASRIRHIIQYQINSSQLSLWFLILTISSFLVNPDLSLVILCSSKDVSLSNASINTCVFLLPIVLTQQSHEGVKKKYLSSDECSDTLSIVIPTYSGKEYTISLVKNRALISDRYFTMVKSHSDRSKHSHSNKFLSRSNDHRSTIVDDDAFYSNNKLALLHDFKSNQDHCHYHGFVEGHPRSIVALSIVGSGLLSGLLHVDGEVYYLIADEIAHKTVMSTKITNVSFDLNLDSPCTKSRYKSRHRRDTSSLNRYMPVRQPRAVESNPNNKVIQQPFQSNNSSLYVELLVVHDHSQYIEFEKNTSLIAERTMQIVNIMNSFYRQLNIFVALVGVVLWVEKDEIKLTDDGDTTLTNFLKYRNEKLLPRYHHDNAQLITSTSFNGSVVGKALKGPICTHDHSGGVNTDHSHNPAIVAVTLAHELGHNLGMEHDEEDKCKCPDEKCIMSSSSSLVHPKHWSSCSIDYLEDSRKHGLLECLEDEPEHVFGPICGNGFVEEGEDCDVGEPMPSYGTSRSRSNKNSIRSSEQSGGSSSLVKNPCCDRKTCKFTINATCAQGPCCDLGKCSVYDTKDAKVCRPRKTQCDFEEICDGKSEYCPPDVHYHNGIECDPIINITGNHLSLSISSSVYNSSRAYCYNGRCANQESQCQLLWGSTGATSQDLCYEQNLHGNTSGHCGFDRLTKTFHKCVMENIACGMLHCEHDQPNSGDINRRTGKLNHGFESASILATSFFEMNDHIKIYCYGAIIDSGPNVRDPGLVPNGAACGEERMCLDQKCVSVQDILNENWCASDCNGNGICDNLGICHCNDGTVGSSCYQFFNSNFHLSLIFYMIMFFGPIVALILFAANHYGNQIKIWWFLHNRKIELRNRYRDQGGNGKRMAYDANGHKVTISDPIPFNHKSANGITINQTVDPWAEYSDRNGQSRSIGYRLEPLKQQQPPRPPERDYPPDLSSAMFEG